uniref:C2H2-type domain-containing protein n=1 Tax=Oncorhynchus mykiss TaxID=8022 RepID=A0A8C7RTX6_ONCMY
MKPQSKTNTGIKRETSMSAQARPSKTAGEGEVSLSFQDELAATIHGAFEVAVEIAVLEVTKLVGQALGDVRDQMHETLRENKSLKQRLQTTEQELNAARQCVETTRGVSPQGQFSTSPLHNNNLAKTQKQSKDNELNIKSSYSLDEYGYEIVEAEISSERQKDHGSFSEISEDGRVCSQDLHPATRGQSIPHHDLLKEVGEEASSLCMDHKSKMLEEWKPDPLDLQISDSLLPGTSHSLSHPHMVNTDVPQLTAPTASGLPAFSSQFPNNLFQPREAAAPIIPVAPPQIYGVQIRTNPNPTIPHPNPNPTIPHPSHICKLCGQGFHQPSELRRHHTQAHPKRQVFPPGQSPYHCSECDRDFNRLENLKTHLRIHTGERPYTCSVCSMRFRHSGALTRHFRIHTGEKPYVCGQCGKTFRNCGGLRFHQRSHSRQGQC